MSGYISGSGAYNAGYNNGKNSVQIPLNGLVLYKNGSWYNTNILPIGTYGMTNSGGVLTSTTVGAGIWTRPWAGSIKDSFIVAIKVTNSSGPSQYGYGNTSGTLPTLITQGTNRTSFTNNSHSNKIWILATSTGQTVYYGNQQSSAKFSISEIIVLRYNV